MADNSPQWPEVHDERLVRESPFALTAARFVRIDCQDLILDSAPVSAKTEAVICDRLEIIPRQPLLDQGRLRERAQDLFRRMRYLTFDNDGSRSGRRFLHGPFFQHRRACRRGRAPREPLPYQRAS